MLPLSAALRAVLTVFWIGGLWGVGVLVAPVLFHSLDNATAGRIAGQLFRIMAWVGMVAGSYILLHMLWQEGFKALRSLDWWLIVLMLALTLLNHFLIFPILADLKAKVSAVAEGAFGGGFQSWHTISSLIYLVQSVAGLAYCVRGNSR